MNKFSGSSSYGALSSILHICLGSIVILQLAGCQSSPDKLVYEEINPVVSHQCDNDVTIQCYGSACTADTKDGHEHVTTSFDEAGNLRICTRSGCWEGQAEVSSSDEFLVLIGKDIEFTANDPSQSKQENIAIILDNKDSVAVLKAGIYSQPLFCN